MAPASRGTNLRSRPSHATARHRTIAEWILHPPANKKALRGPIASARLLSGDPGAAFGFGGEFAQ
jgi:hypothetical protein